VIKRIAKKLTGFFTKAKMPTIEDDYAKKNITFKSDLVIGNSFVISAKFGSFNKVNDSSFLMNVEYGDFTYSAMNVTILNCKIGKFCSLAQGVCIGLGKHPVNNFVSTHPSFYSVHKQCGFTFADKQYFQETGFVEIGNDVWVGANSIIADDVKVGNGAIIAANSFVNTDVPAYAIVGGTPAKIIKYRFSIEQIDFLQSFEWWNKDIKWIQENYLLFHDIDNFMELTK